jgi:hypothetical protein
LGGAGFASLRTIGEDCRWDLSKFAGLQVDFSVDKSDQKKYTVILKDTLLPPNPVDGREQSTVSWEHDFSVADVGGTYEAESQHYRPLGIPWTKFKPTYRGKPVNDCPDLDTSNVKRFSVMIRRYVVQPGI